MNGDITKLFALLGLLMYAVGILLFFINLLSGTSGDAYFMRIKIFCALMVGATILLTIGKTLDKNNQSDDQ